MSYARQLALPSSEPVAVGEAKTFMKVPSFFTADDSMITGFIQAAREHAEKQTGRCLAQRQFALVLDSHPYYTDTIATQQAYPPSYYSLPRYSTTLWNYSQLIKLPFPPLKSVDAMRYIGADGVPVTLNQDEDFVVDRISEPARIFPIPGSFWPADQYVANAVQITFTTGYDPSPTAAADTHTMGEPITNVAVNNNLLTVACVSDFAVGKQLTFVNVAAATFLNGQVVTIASNNGAQITAAFTHANYASATDTGMAQASPANQQPTSTVVLAVPQMIRTAIMMLVNHWYVNREPVAAGSVGTIPQHLDQLLWNEAVVDFAPTRG